jgi:magnesium-transporting ATPase (P-type)
MKNSGRVLALVVHTGSQSKLIMNFGKYDFKRPQFEVFLNWILVLNFCIMIALTIVLTIGNHIWNSKNYDLYGYIFNDGPSASELT